MDGEAEQEEEVEEQAAVAAFRGSDDPSCTHVPSLADTVSVQSRESSQHFVGFALKPARRLCDDDVASKHRLPYAIAPVLF